MKLIVGLGNPDQKYELTRHNIGFLVLEKVVEEKKLIPFRLQNQFKSQITQTGGIGEHRIILVKPMNYMNNSGEAVKQIMSYYKIGHDDLLVLCDDLDLDIGTIRIRTNGSSGGHNGLKSIIQNVKSQDFLRIKIGIGSNRNTNIKAEDYVLSKFKEDEKIKINKTVDNAVKLVVEFIDSGNLKEKTIKVS